MTALWVLVPLALLMGASFAGAFLWAVRDGQFDDLDDPAERVLEED